MGYKFKKGKLVRTIERSHKIILILLAVIAVMAVYIIWPILNDINYFVVIPDLFTEGYTQVTVDAAVIEDVGYVSLTGGCYRVIAHTETVQAESIANGRAGIMGFRPGTHDLMKDLIENYEIEILMVKITEVKNETFLGRMIVRQGNKVVNLDARPSDGTAIAVRTDTPVYMKDELLEEYGENICSSLVQ